MLMREVGEAVTRLTSEMDKVVIGYKEIKLYSLAALLSDQHVLLEGMPGTAKSLFVEVFQRAVSNSASVRVQLTADVKPMDIQGVKVYNPAKMGFEIDLGPICGKNFVLFDEINRAPGKSLSSILSAMQERRVYINGQLVVLPDPFFVMATQNPIEQEGVYPLPEAAVDRFGAKIGVGYPAADVEEQILASDVLDQRDPQSVVNPVVDVQDIVRMREGIKKAIFVSKAARQYMVALNRATRPGLDEYAAIAKKEPAFGKLLQFGGSIRGPMSVRGISRVLAAVKGRNYVLPEDVQEVAKICIHHRIGLTFDAQAAGSTTDDALDLIVKHTPFHKDTKQYAPGAA